MYLESKIERAIQLWIVIFRNLQFPLMPSKFFLNEIPGLYRVVTLILQLLTVCTEQCVAVADVDTHYCNLTPVGAFTMELQHLLSTNLSFNIISNDKHLLL